MSDKDIRLEVRPRSFSIGMQTYPLGQIARISVVEVRKTWKGRMFIVCILAVAGPAVALAGSVYLDDELVAIGEVLTVGLGFVAVLGLVGVLMRVAYRDYMLMLETAGTHLGVLSSRSQQAIMELRNDIVEYIDRPPSAVVVKQLDNRVFNIVKGGKQINQTGGRGNVAHMR